MSDVARRVGRSAAAVAWAGAVVAFPPPAAAQTQEAPATATVAMRQFRFMPSSVTIREGGTVTWNYAETATDVPPGCESPVFQVPGPLACPGHSTTSQTRGPDGAPLWDSGVRRAGGFPYRVRFDRPGTFRYLCTVHPTAPLGPMTGEVVVLPARAATPGPSGGGTTASPPGPVPGLPGGGRTSPTTAPRATARRPVTPLASTGGESGAAWFAAVGLGAAVLLRRYRSAAGRGRP